MHKFYEKKVKELSVKPYNKECFDCGKKGVQGNINLTHNTFICTRCAGLHRGLSHKANSIGMVNFTKEIYEALEAGGNKRAKKHWLAKLPEDYKRPEQNEQKMVEFLNLVYVQQRFVRKEGDPKKPHTAKKSKPKSATRDAEPKSGSESGHSRSQSQSSTPVIPSQKTGDSQISHNSHSTHSGGSEKDDGDSDNEDTHKSSRSLTGATFDVLTDFTVTEADGKTSQNGHVSSKTSEPDIFGDSSPGLDTPPKHSSKTRTPVDALVEHFREVMREFHLTSQQIKSITSEALVALAEAPEERAEGESDGGNPFDDEFDDEPATTSTPIQPLKPATSSSTSRATSSSSLFPDLDSTPAPTVQLGGPPSSGFGTSYRPPALPQTPQTYPSYGQTTYAPSPATSMSMGMSGVLPGMTSGGYHQPTASYPQGYPPGVSYNMSISMGGFSPYPQHPHSHPSAFSQQPQPQPQVPEKPKGPDLFAGLDPFARS